MAQLVTVRLARHDSTPWGFRLQGGKDFGTPLLIQKVNGGSLAEQAGLAVGDGLIKVNGQDVFDLRHKDAQDAIVHGGNSLELQVQRGGGSTWKPLVTSIGSTPSPLPHVSGPPPCVTKTSLAANKYPGKTPLIGSGHNIAPKPFNGLPHSQLNGNANGSVKAIVNKQYNTPVGIYSEETIAETLSAQAEVLAGGVLGVNFKKNEKHYNAQNSEVLKMVQEADAEPRSPEPAEPVEQNGVVIPPPVKGLRHVSAPENKPVSPQSHGGSQPLLPGQNICADCERLIVGVFVRIKDKNLHVECFKCATCGTSLKNVGYYNINNKLYCDIHAKMIARQNPPAPNLEPVTVSPGGRIPSNVVSNAINSAMSPKSNSVSSPFQVRHVPMHVSSPMPTPSQTPSSNILSPKSFNGTSAPLTPPISSNFSPRPQTGAGGATKGGTAAGLTVPRRGRGVLNPQNLTPGARVPLCGQCHEHIRGPFITALGKIWCPDHFICVNKDCRRPLQDIGFVEESSGLYCEYCFEQFLAPTCHKCSNKIKGDCLNAIGKHFHPECFKCAFCSKLFGNNPFFLEEGLPYCENDWNELFTTKCFACGFPIEAGDRWVEALNNNYHSPCFNCTMCKKNLEGESFYAKGGRPYCKSHAR